VTSSPLLRGTAGPAPVISKRSLGIRFRTLYGDTTRSCKHPSNLSGRSGLGCLAAASNMTTSGETPVEYASTDSFYRMSLVGDSGTLTHIIGRPALGAQTLVLNGSVFYTGHINMLTQKASMQTSRDPRAKVTTFGRSRR
jgi:hypothetical protein